MKAIDPYLFFNGNCREAIHFYAGVFGGTVNLTTYAEASPDLQGGGDRIRHAHLTDGAFSLMAADCPPGQPVGVGGNFGLLLDCADEADQDRLFAALSAGGRVTMRPQNTFGQARFAMLFDRFGTQWMLSCPLASAPQGFV